MKKGGLSLASEKSLGEEAEKEGGKRSSAPCNYTLIEKGPVSPVQPRLDKHASLSLYRLSPHPEFVGDLSSDFAIASFACAHSMT